MTTRELLDLLEAEALVYAMKPGTKDEQKAREAGLTNLRKIIFSLLEFKQMPEVHPELVESEND